MDQAIRRRDEARAEECLEEALRPRWVQGLGERIGKDMLLICLERGVFGKLGGCMSDADVLRVWASFWAFESFFFRRGQV